MQHYTLETKNQTIELRNKYYFSYAEIANLLNVKSKGTIWNWLHSDEFSTHDKHFKFNVYEEEIIVAWILHQDYLNLSTTSKMLIDFIKLYFFKEISHSWITSF